MQVKNWIIVFILLFTFSCKEDTATRTELLTNHTWYHNNNMMDLNSNQKPDDEKGALMNKSFNFSDDGTLEFTYNDVTKNLTWFFEDNESSIRIYGTMHDSIISGVQESVHPIYQIDENTLIFLGFSMEYPDLTKFEIYSKE